jgi:hypothetical protein
VLRSALSSSGEKRGWASKGAATMVPAEDRVWHSNLGFCRVPQNYMLKTAKGKVVFQ